jgi:PAS domain S-box-containing protein
LEVKKMENNDVEEPAGFDKSELRRKAEEQVRHAPHDVSKMTAPQIQELVQELQVHQVELEMMVDELRSSQADLTRSHGQYRDLYEDAPVGYLTLDADETIVKANATAGVMLQRSIEQLQGKRLSSLAIPEDRDRCYLYIHKVIQGQSSQTADIRFTRLVDRQTIHVRLGAMRTVGAGGTAGGEWRVGMMDITDAKQAELALEENEHRLRILNENLESLVVQRTEQVLALSTALTLAEQRERKQFSQILHEDIQQKLYGARMLFKQHLRDHRETGVEEESDDITQGIAVLENALRTTKALSIELNPPVLSSEGLDAALRWLAAHKRTTYGFTVELRMQGPVGTVRHQMQIMLTQMVRELLNNVRRHAGVSEALVEVRCEEKSIHITISDKGRGFDPQKALLEETDKSRRLGLVSIKERLRLFGGELTIQSAPGQGTQVTIVLPYLNY